MLLFEQYYNSVTENPTFDPFIILLSLLSLVFSLLFSDETKMSLLQKGCALFEILFHFYAFLMVQSHKTHKIRYICGASD